MKNKPTIIGCVISCLILLVTLLCGYRVSIVLSGSMEPYIKVNSLIVTKPCDSRDILVGDVIVYWDGSKNVVHRVIEIRQGVQGYEYVTKGDNNLTEDKKAVNESNVISKVHLVLNKASYIIERMTTEGNGGRYEISKTRACVIMLGLGVCIYLIIAFLAVAAHNIIRVTIKTIDKHLK